MQLGLDRVWLFLAIALPALAALIAPLPAVDLAYQVRTGDLILATGQIPSTDTFTFTVAGSPWLDQQWLAQVLLAAGYRLGGWEALAVLRALLVAATFGLVAAVAIARGASRRTASILALLAFAISSPALALRPQLFGIVIFAVLLLLVAVRDRHPRWLLLVPALACAWANLHGSFVLVPLLLGYAWLDDVVRHRPARRSLAVLVAGTVATVVTPFGLGVWGYAIGIGADPLIAGQVSEWQRTTPFTVPGLLFYASALAALGFAVWRRTRLSLADWLWLASLLLIGAWAVRGLAWWPLGAALVVAAALPEGPASHPSAVSERASRLNLALVGVIGIATVLALPWWRPTEPLAGRQGLLSYAPSDLAVALRGVVRPGDRVFVPQAWASWFEWAVPDARYFLDSRFELYPAAVWQDYGTIANDASGAGAVLDRWSVDTVVAPDPAGTAPAGWSRITSEGDGSILVRGTP